MTMNTLKDVYHDQLQDLWSANKQSLEAVTELGRAASNKELSEALIRGASGIMEGLVKEAHAHVLEAPFGDDDVRDAMIITQYQRMVHYALAGYGCLVAFANRLDQDEDGAILQECLDNTYDGDRVVTEIAMGGLNKAAA